MRERGERESGPGKTHLAMGQMREKEGKGNSRLTSNQRVFQFFPIALLSSQEREIEWDTHCVIERDNQKTSNHGETTEDKEKSVPDTRGPRYVCVKRGKKKRNRWLHHAETHTARESGSFPSAVARSQVWSKWKVKNTTGKVEHAQIVRQQRISLPNGSICTLSWKKELGIE